MYNVHRTRISAIDKLHANHFRYTKLIDFIISRNDSIESVFYDMIVKFELYRK